MPIEEGIPFVLLYCVLPSTPADKVSIELRALRFSNLLLLPNAGGTKAATLASGKKLFYRL
jgi:hypothetical protein